MGNDFTADTFRYARKRVYLLNNCPTRVFPEPLRRDPGKCRKSYLWMGGSGLVLKGLDLVLEAFSSMPDYTLTVCGPVESERDFRDAFHKELYLTPNIRTIGFIDIGSERFPGIASECIAIIYPSASEGQAGSVIDGMHAGLIPLVSSASGVDPGPGGFILEDVSAKGIEEAVRMVSGLPDEELVRRSRETWSYAMANYTREKFSGEYRRIITEILAETDAGKDVHESTVR
jgi:glycosyltransferase involved in cell wall biosynthesis